MKELESTRQGVASTGRIPNPDLQPCIQQAHSLCANLHCPSPQPQVLLQTRRGSFYIPQLFYKSSQFV